MEIKEGTKFFWNGIFPYVITKEDDKSVSYTRVSDGFATRRVYRYVFENAIKTGKIQPLHRL